MRDKSNVGQKIVNSSVSGPMGILTVYGTALYVDTRSGSLRHAPIDAKLEIVAIASSGGRGHFLHVAGAHSRPIIFGDEFALTVAKSNTAAVSPLEFEIDPFFWAGREWFGLKANNLFLCAERDGSITLSRSHRSTWESFTLSVPRSVEILTALTLLKPYDVPQLAKRRFGDRCDGGYVLLDDLESVGPVYSIGIGDHVSFDEALALAGKEVFMFDHTVDRPPICNPNFRFFKRGVAAKDSESSSVYTIQRHIEVLEHGGRNDLLLKIDVEGAEFDVFSNMSRETLCHFRQITMELHWLRRLADAEYRAQFIRALTNINSVFTLFHVHANNYAPIDSVDGYVVADVMELSFIRSDLVERVESKTIYPTDIDCPNWPAVPDHLLWFYPFLPTRDGAADFMNAKLLASIRASNKFHF